ncbi:MAG: hypothetical protein CVU81_03105 [Euryarchaeota archaeon HGW-Euryarchaeota-1]|nr:MAG: hypothetical protein CVU81_03105 [Euryarchaeota archaeon HGW-Euryarchaeota-1]
MILVLQYEERYNKSTINLIKEILVKEFGSIIDKKGKDFDLHNNNISKIYQKNNGNFWIAVDGKEVIGTIALIDYKGG